jgi:2-iminobutanoate/2-iminopropanoate deaminase
MNVKLLTLVVAVNILAPVAAQAAEPGRSYVMVDSSAARSQLPFSDAVKAGNTLYVSGTLGMDPSTVSDPKTARVASEPADEARFALEAVKRTLEAAGYKMDDLVAVQIYCTDLDLYGTFNDVYRTFFHGHFPARAFIGVNKLVRGARFEVMGTAVKTGK